MSKAKEKKPARVVHPKASLPPGHVHVADCPGRFLVLEGMKNDGTVNLKDLAGVRGPFASVQAAEKNLREDAVDTFEGDPESSMEDLENWGSDCLIVEVKRVVRPVPVVSVKAEIKTIAGEEARTDFPAGAGENRAPLRREQPGTVLDLLTLPPLLSGFCGGGRATF